MRKILLYLNEKATCPFRRGGCMRNCLSTKRITTVCMRLEKYIIGCICAIFLSLGAYSQEILIDGRVKTLNNFSCGEMHTLRLSDPSTWALTFPSPYCLWQRSDNDGASWQNILESGSEVYSINVVNHDGTKQLYRAIIADSESDATNYALSGNATGQSILVSDEVSIQCDLTICNEKENRLVVWMEDFKSVPRGERRECDNLVGLKFAGKYNSSGSTNIGDGKYGVVSHSADGSIPSYNWFSGGTDHTGNKDGGFLIINNVDGGAPDVLLYEKTIDFDLCPDTWYYFSLYAMCISGGAIGDPDDSFAHCNFTFEIIGEDGVTVLALDKSGDVPLSNYGISSWYNYGVSFNSGNNKNVILRIYDSAKKNMWGNDMAVDDISLIACEKPIPETTLGVGLEKDKEGVCDDHTTLSLSNMSQWENELPNVYCTWQISEDGGFTWNTMPESGEKVYSVEVPFQKSVEGIRYRVIVSKDQASGQFIAQNGYSDDACHIYKISNVSTLTCHCETPELSISPADPSFCTDSITLSAKVENAAPVDSFVWSCQDVSTGDWVAIADQRGPSISVFDQIERKYCVVAWNDTCHSDSVFITIKENHTDSVPLKITGDGTICENGSTTLSLTGNVLDQITWMKREEGESDFSPLGAADAPQATVSPSKTTYYRAETAVLPGQCIQGISDTFIVKVDAPATLTLASSADAVCVNDNVTLSADYGTATAIVWEKQEEGETAFTDFSTDLTQQQVVNPTHKTTYRIRSAQNNACPESVSDEVTITTEDSLRVSVEPIETTLCEGTAVSLKASVTGTPASVTWEKQVGGQTSVLANDKETTDTPTQSCEYMVTAAGQLCPDATQSLSVTVDNQATLTLSASADAVCVNDNVTLSASYGTATAIVWEKKEEGENAFTDFSTDLTQQQVVNPTHKTTYRIRSAQNNACPESYSDEVTVSTEDSLRMNLQPIAETVKEGNSVTLKATIVQGTPTSFTWEKETDSGKSTLGTQYEATDTPSENSTYIATVHATYCPEVTLSQSIIFKPLIILSLSSVVDTICEGEEVVLTASYGVAEGIAWEKQEEGSSGYEEFATDLTTQKNVMPMVTTRYRIRSTGDDVVYSNDVTIHVVKPVEIELVGDESTCKGSDYTINFRIKNGQDVSSVTLYESVNGEIVNREKIEGYTSGDYNGSSLYTLQEETTFSLKATAKYCPEKEATHTVKIDTVPTHYELTASADSICRGDYVEISTDFPFSLNNLLLSEEYEGESSHSESSYMTSETERFHPEETVRYTLVPRTENGCLGEERSVTVQVFDPGSSTTQDTSVCMGDRAFLRVVGGELEEKYVWSTSPDYSDIIATGNRQVVLPEETTTYYVKAMNGKCERTMEQTIYVLQKPSILVNQEDAQTIVLEGVGGSGDYWFDLGSGFERTNTMHNVTPNWTYTVKVKDDAGCMNDTTFVSLFYDLFIPEYFTPQGDGSNDTWKIVNLEYYANVRVSIFDRHGKKIFESTDPEQEWDGTYNGHALPSEDYWYVVNIYDIRAIFTGHFTLIR